MHEAASGVPFTKTRGYVFLISWPSRATSSSTITRLPAAPRSAPRQPRSPSFGRASLGYSQAIRRRTAPPPPSSSSCMRPVSYCQYQRLRTARPGAAAKSSRAAWWWALSTRARRRASDKKDCKPHESRFDARCRRYGSRYHTCVMASSRLRPTAYAKHMQTAALPVRERERAPLTRPPQVSARRRSSSARSPASSTSSQYLTKSSSLLLAYAPTPWPSPRTSWCV